MFRRGLALLLLMLVVSGVTFAQPDPNAPEVANAPARAANRPVNNNAGRQANAQPPIMLADAQSLFILENGVLGKFDSATLQAMGTVELFGPLAAVMAPAGARQNLQQNLQQVIATRAQPAAMLQHDAALLIVIGNDYFFVDATTLKVKVNATILPAAPAGVGAINPQLGAMAPAPGLLLTPPTLLVADDTLYVLSAGNLVAVNIPDGKVAATGMLPAIMTAPAQAIRQVGNKAAPAPGVAPGAVAGGGRGAGVGGGGRAGRPARGAQDQAVPAAPVTLIGVITHQELEGGFWTIKLDNGDEYVLQGAEAETLVATPGIAGSSVRVTGLTEAQMGIAQYGKGYLTVTKYQMLAPLR